MGLRLAAFGRRSSAIIIIIIVIINIIMVCDEASRRVRYTYLILIFLRLKDNVTDYLNGCKHVSDWIVDCKMQWYNYPISCAFTFLPNKWLPRLSSWVTRRAETWAVKSVSKMVPETIHKLATSRASNDLGALSPYLHTHIYRGY